MSPKAVRRAVTYARISVASDESVSVERQVQAAEQYAAARGWQVVGTFTDEGVSATHNRPEDRTGWQAVLRHLDPYDVVIIWKVDRLARRVLDFLHADAALQDRGAGIVAVEQSIDMTTGEGRAFAQMLAVFGEMEAAAISARVKAARTHLLRAGRVVGGTVPYGWCSVPNPDGAGYVLAHDPERIQYVRGMADRVLAGASVYSVVQWLDEVQAPLPRASQANRKTAGWRYTTVEALLRNPLLAGMTAHNPGNDGKRRGAEVLRDADGLPVVDESVAIMPVHEWRAMVRQMDDRDSAQRRPRALRAKTSGLLSGLVWCGECDVRMHRGTTQGRPSYTCPKCYQTVSRLDGPVVQRFLQEKGDWDRWPLVEEVHEAPVLPEIEHRLAELTAQLQETDDDDEADRLQEDIARLRRRRREARTAAPVVTLVQSGPVQTYAQAWAAAGDDVQAQRAVLGDGLERVQVRRGRRGGHGVDPARLTFTWTPEGGQAWAP